jgi:vancomycin resistance protein VanJ
MHLPISKLMSGLKKRIHILAWLALVALFIGQLGSVYWIFELFSHFTPFYVLLFFLVCFCCPSKKQRLVFAIVAAAGCYWCLTPWFNTHSADTTQAKPVRFLSYNVLNINAYIDTESKWLLRNNSDIIFLTETSLAWGTALQPLAATTQHCAEYNDSPFGMALYSHLPLTSCEVRYTTANDIYPYIRAQLQNGLVVYGIHPPPPITATLVQERNNQLQALATMIKQEKNNVIVLGDMNISAFSPVFRDFIQAADVHLTSPRARPTWLPALLSIDHTLVRQPDKIVATGSYSWHGSDHKAIWISYVP